MPEFVKADGGVVHYDLTGDPDAPAFVLIEGLGAHMIAWRTEFYQPIIDAGYRVVRLDNRDVGLSQRYPEGDYTLSELADDTHQLIQHLSIAPAHLVAQSLGGMVALHLACDHAGDVASLSLLYTAPSSAHLTGVKRVEALRASPRATSRAEAIELHIESERLGASDGYTWDETWKRHLAGLMWDRGYDPDGVIRQCEALLTDHIDPHALAKLQVPVLILHGTADALIPHQAGIALQHMIPGSELWLINGMGHDLPLELIPQLTGRILTNANRAHTQSLTQGATS